MSEIVTHRRTRQLKGQLTDPNLRNLTTRDRPYKVAYGNGLHVLVSPTGLRAWRWKYRFARREKVLPLGRYPDVSLVGRQGPQFEGSGSARAFFYLGVWPPLETALKSGNAPSEKLRPEEDVEASGDLQAYCLRP